MGFVRWWDAPTHGEAPDLAPHMLDGQQATRLRNFLVDNPGRIIPRGKLGGAAATETGSLVDTTNGGAMLVAFAFDDIVIVDYRAPSATPLVDYWRVPINRPATAPELAQPSLGATASRFVDLKTGSVTDIANSDPLSAAGPSITRVDDAIYTATFSGPSATIPTGVAPLNAIRKADIVGSAVVLTNGPRFVQAVFTHYGRLYAAAARQPGGSDYNTSQIFFSLPGGTTAFTDTTADWFDPDTGEMNFIEVGAANDGDFIVGFGRAGGHLLIFKRNSVWIMYGTAPSNFTLRQLRTQSGCLDLRSIVVADEGTYFASQLGYELFDGVRFTTLTDPINDTWMALSNAGVGSGSVNHAYIQADPLPNGYLHVALGTDSTAANADDGTVQGWLLQRSTGAWVDLTSAVPSLGLAAGGHLHRFVMSRAHVVALGAARWALADDLAYGTAAVGVFDEDAAGTYDVDLLWQTSLDDMGSYRHLDGRWVTNTLENVSASYSHAYTNSAPADGTPFATLTGVDGSGATLVPALPLPGHTPPGPHRTRPMLDAKQDSRRGDISFTLESALGYDPDLRTGSLAVHGLGVKYSHGEERRRA